MALIKRLKEKLEVFKHDADEAKIQEFEAQLGSLKSEKK
jgi:hypothetical protein